MYNPFTLEGKTILVTGASSGIGRQCAIDCSRMGAKVVAVGRNQERLNSVISEMGGHGISYSFNLEKIESIGELISDIVSKYGKLDGFIHAAGIEVTNPVKLSKTTDYESLFEKADMGAFLCANSDLTFEEWSRREIGFVVNHDEGFV